MNRILNQGLKLALCSLICVSGSSIAEIYKWTENGKVHYSDKPDRRARSVKKLKLQKLTTHVPVYVDSSRTNIPVQRKKHEISKTYNVSINKPTNDQSFSSNAGTVSLAFSVSPILKSGSGHVVRYSVDKQASIDTSELEISLNNVHRGTHTLNVQIFDNQGIALSPKVTSTFHMQRPSPLIQQNLKNLGVSMPNMSSAKPKKGLNAAPINPK